MGAITMGYIRLYIFSCAREFVCDYHFFPPANPIYFKGLGFVMCDILQNWVQMEVKTLAPLVQEMPRKK